MMKISIEVSRPFGVNVSVDGTHSQCPIPASVSEWLVLIAETTTAMELEAISNEADRSKKDAKKQAENKLNMIKAVLKDNT